MSTPKRPIFDLKERFDGTITIGPKDRAIVIPISVKRFSKSEMEEFQQEWDRFVEVPETPLSAEDRKEHDRALLRFYENRIRECITLEPGYIRDRGTDVVDGSGIINVFHARHDILAQFVAQIFVQNKLGGEIVKNLSSPLGSVTGSTASVLTSGELLTGAEPASAVGTAEPKDSASNVDAEELPSGQPSGRTPTTH